MWFFWGDAAKFPNALTSSPPIPAIPELDDPNWSGTWGEMQFDCGYMALVDNLLDCAHIHFLHNGSFGVDDAPAVQVSPAWGPSPSPAGGSVDEPYIICKGIKTV